VHATALPGGNVVHAQRVTIRPVGTFFFNATVMAIGPGSFVAMRAEGATTVEILPHTAYSERGVVSPSFSSLAVGEQVSGYAKPTSSANVVDATLISITVAR